MKKLIAIILLALFAVTSCKKDPSTQILNSSKNITTVTTNTVAASYNISYHLWYPYQTISVPWNNNSPPYTNTSHSILISLDSSNTNNIELYVSEQFLGLFGGGMPTPEYSYNTEVLRSGANSVFLASLKLNSTCILTNDSINDNLQWTTSLDLRNGSYGNGTGNGDWDRGGVNNGYVGIKIVTSLGNKYGWIKISVPNSYNMTMEAQALNNNYGQHIQAGQTH